MTCDAHTFVRQDAWLLPRLVPLPFTNVSCKMRWFTDPACWILPIALLGRAADAALPWVHESFDSSQPFRGSSAQRCGEVLGWDILQQYSKSQSKEDYTLWHSFFKQLCKGSYLELGALDGLRYSNSYLFSKALNWTGTLVEASPTNFKKLKANRPKDALFHNAICNSTGVVHMVDRGPVGGIYEFMPEGFRQRFHSKLDIAGLPKVICKPLSSILEPHRFIDFFSLDVEGGELEVLKTIDFTRIDFGVLFFESDVHNPIKNQVTKSFLQSQGYIFLQESQRSAWFMNRNFHKFYQHILYPKLGRQY